MYNSLICHFYSLRLDTPFISKEVDSGDDDDNNNNNNNNIEEA
jgi:hypothetical protein